MTDPVNNKKNNFDPNSYQAPEFRRGEDGNYDPTTYQTAMGLREFMNKNNLSFVSIEQMYEAVSKGTVTDGDRVIQLNDREKVIFKKAEDGGLFKRLDAGTNNTHDGWVGIQDINDAIKQSWKLHGTEKSPEGEWTDPMSNSKMTVSEAKTTFQEYWSKHIGRDDAELPWTHAKYIINNHGDGKTYVDDPRMIEAMYIIDKHWGAIDADGDNWVTKSEVDNWKP